MRVGVFLKRWIDVLVALLLGRREAWRARRSLIVARDQSGFVARRAAKARDITQAAASSDIKLLPGKVPADIAQAARNGLIVLELPADQVVVRRIAVPAKAREFLPGIVRNQLERLSPWQADRAVYGFEAKPSAEDATALDVRVCVSSRAIVEAARAELAALGLTVDRIVAPADGTAASVAVWSRLADSSRESIARARWLIGGTLAACLAVGLGVSVWGFASAAALQADSEEIAARAKVLQRQLQAPHAARSLASLSPAERAWVSKETSPASFVVIEVLSRVLPDSAYLTELQLDGTTVRMIGLASDAPSLLAPLERSGHFVDVHFFAPTTRAPDGKLFRFNIEARVEPRLDIAGE